MRMTPAQPSGKPRSSQLSEEQTSTVAYLLTTQSACLRNDEEFSVGCVI
jgi:hypothetical protein